MISLTCEISNILVLRNRGILPKVDELLEDLILYNKTLDRINNQTSLPACVLAEINDDFYFDKDVFSVEVIGFRNMQAIHIVQRVLTLQPTYITQKNHVNFYNKEAYDQIG